VNKLVNNIKNELSSSQVGEKMQFKRVVIDELDAEEYLRHVTQLEAKKDAMINELEVFKKEIDEMLKHKKAMQDIRMMQINADKAERNAALKKQNGQEKKN